MNGNVNTTASTTSEKTASNRPSMPRILLRLEGVIVLLASFALYSRVGESWWLFVILAFAPDLVFIIYALNRSIGTVLYNIIHTYSLPVALGAIALLANWQIGVAVAIIWIAHIAWDRAIDAGLKYPTGFSDTHLQRV
jgi:hypothetical protein